MYVFSYQLFEKSAQLLASDRAVYFFFLQFIWFLFFRSVLYLRMTAGFGWYLTGLFGHMKQCCSQNFMSFELKISQNLSEMVCDIVLYAIYLQKYSVWLFLFFLQVANVSCLSQAFVLVKMSSLCFELLFYTEKSFE